MSSTTNTNEPQFSKLRRMLFPIQGYEMKKAIPMGFIFFFILFNYTCLRNLKDALVVTNSGAEALSYLKLFCVTPSAILFMLVVLRNAVAVPDLFRSVCVRHLPKPHVFPSVSRDDCGVAGGVSDASLADCARWYLELRRVLCTRGVVGQYVDFTLVLAVCQSGVQDVGSKPHVRLFRSDGAVFIAVRRRRRQVGVGYSQQRRAG